MHCKFCEKFDKSGKRNSFRNPGCGSIRLQEVKVHEASEQHVRSEAAELASVCAPNKLPIIEAVLKMEQNQKVHMRILFKIAFWLAQKGSPYTDFARIIELLQAIREPISDSYKNDKQAKCFISFIHKMMNQQVVADLEESEFFSVLCDGTTDVSTREQEIVYVRFLRHGRPQTQFITLKCVEKADAEHIKEALVEVFENDLRLSGDAIGWKSGLIGASFDGASVMMGHRNGVSITLRESVPHLISIHSSAHRLELAVKDTIKMVSYMSVFDEVLQAVFKHYKNSAKNFSELRQTTNALNCKLMRPVNLYGTRWLPHHERAVKSMEVSYQVYSTHLENTARSGNKEQKEKARSILKNL
ncbi:zinc finger protein 862-like [Gigantopelta aegis]|uniref:zinc finger protein 862-like n=1 Tax=Gigantopelta aegis TaxID=1735272 RepID=UPI001B887428|nr:zinc finger protein 862-like [Gigantopelta aegis]